MKREKEQFGLSNEDYMDLEEFLESEFIPSNIRYIQQQEEDNYPVYYGVIDADKIKRLALSNNETKYILESLKDKDIGILGISESLKEFENYYFCEENQVQTFPKCMTNDTTLLKIAEYQKTKDLRIRNEVIEGNIQLIKGEVNYFSTLTGININELFSHGYEALIYAVEKFDPTKGRNFKDYALKAVKYHILDAFRCQQGLNNRRLSILKYFQVIEKIEKTNGISLEENALLICDIARRLVEEGIISENQVSKFEISYLINHPLYFEDIAECKDYTDFDAELLKISINEALNTLSERESKVLELRFGLNDTKECTLSEVGKRLNIVKESVRQTERKALVKLKHPSRTKKLKHYL